MHDCIHVGVHAFMHDCIHVGVHAFMHDCIHVGLLNITKQRCCIEWFV